MNEILIKTAIVLMWILGLVGGTLLFSALVLFLYWGALEIIWKAKYFTSAFVNRERKVGSVRCGNVICYYWDPDKEHACSHSLVEEFVGDKTSCLWDSLKG